MGKPFVKGDPRAGRKPGLKVRLTQTFLTDVLDEWEKHGRDALRIFRVEKPDRFCEMVAHLMPRELTVESIASELSDDEIDQQITFIREQLSRSREQPLLIEAKVNDDRAATPATPAKRN